MIHKRRRFTFRISSLLLVMLLIGVALAWLRQEMRGRVILESESKVPDFPFSSGPPLEIRIPSGASRGALESSIRAALARLAQEQGLPVSEVRFWKVEWEDGPHLYYDYDRWTRERLDLREFRYVGDLNDPVAQARNRRIVETIERTATEFPTSPP